MSETTPIGSFVMGSPAITATDEDTGNFSITLYTLTQLQTTGEPRQFRINQLTGAIDGSLWLYLVSVSVCIYNNSN